MLALVVDTSAHPRAARPRAMCYKCYNESISLTTRLALNEFQASCYPHHRSQSALGDTNRLLRVLGCNLTLNPYLVIQMGHHHGHPLTEGHEITSRPLKHDPEKSHLETPRNYALTWTISKSINKGILIMHITSGQPFKSYSFIYPNGINIISLILEHDYRFVSSHYNHFPLVPTISFEFHTHLIPKSYIQFDIYRFPCSLQVSYFN